MVPFDHIIPVANRQPIPFRCTACGACCKNVRDSVMLEPLDAFRIVRHFRENGCADTAEDILGRIAERKALSDCFDVFVLKTVNDSGVCVMLKNDRCSIYPVRPHTCKLYPFTAEPCPKEHRFRWLLCTEQAHHFGAGKVTAREWQRKNVSAEEKEFLFEKWRVVPQLGELVRKLPEENREQATQMIFAYQYLAYDFEQPFLPQYKENMLFLRSLLGKLAV